MILLMDAIGSDNLGDMLDCYQCHLYRDKSPTLRSSTEQSLLSSLPTPIVMASQAVLTWLNIFGAVVRNSYQAHFFQRLTQPSDHPYLVQDSWTKVYDSAARSALSYFQLCRATVFLVFGSTFRLESICFIFLGPTGIDHYLSNLTTPPTCSISRPCAIQSVKIMDGLFSVPR